MPLSEEEMSINDTETQSKKSKRLQYLVSSLTIVFILGTGVALSIYWDNIYQMAGFGYAGGFIISALGGATVFVPVPIMPVQFALGGVIKPPIGPDILGPLFVGGVCSLGEAIGSASIYITGLAGGSPFSPPKTGRLKRLSDKMLSIIERRGQLGLFLMSAIMNPFFFPASLMLGAARFGLIRYTLIAFAGKFIKCTIIAYAGYFGFQVLFDLFGIGL